jgi:hypothetical protein
MRKFDALLITGETYRNRHAIRGVGGRFDHERGGYLTPDTPAPRELAARLGLIVEAVILDRDPAAAETIEETRARRNAARQRRADRLDSQAETQDRAAVAARARVSPHERDFLALFEPVKRGHHSQRRHEKLIARAQKSFQDEGQARHDAAELRARAHRLRAGCAQVAGDAAARDQAARDAADRVITVASVIRHVVYGEGIVVRVNKKTYSITWSRGSEFPVDKGSVEFVRQGAASETKPTRAHKRGDMVTYLRHGVGSGANERGTPATVLRVNPTGYTIEYFLPSMKSGEPPYRYEEKVGERNLIARQAVAA